MALTEADIKVIIAAELKKQGFDKAQKATTSLESTFKKLGKTVASVFAAREIIRFGKEATAAFIEHEKAAMRLTQTLNGLNMGFLDPSVKAYLETLERQTGVLNDQLRPAFGSLISQTRSFTLSQDLLNTAIDVAAGSGYDLATVVKDLNKAYVGNNTGLTKYNLGLAKAELKTKSFTQVQQLLNKQFSGQNAAYLETYAGKIATVNVGFKKMQDEIGEGLLDAFAQLSGEAGVQGTTNAMIEFGQIAGNVLRGIGVQIGLVTQSVGGKGGLMDYLKLFAKQGNPLASAIVGLAEKGKAAKPLEFPNLGKGLPYYQKQLAKMEKDNLKRQKELIALQKKAEEERKKRERLALAQKRANTVFDMENIQIVAALQEKVDGETRLRLTALLALNTQNSIAAEKLADMVVRLQAPALANLDVFLKSGDTIDDLIVKLITSQAKMAGLQLLAEDFPIPEDIFQEWEDSLDEVLKKLMELLLMLDQIENKKKKTGFYALDALGFSSLESYQNYRQGERASIVNSSAVGSGMTATNSSFIPSVTNNGGATIVVNVAGNVTSERDLVSAITDQIYLQQKSGTQITYNSLTI